MTKQTTEIFKLDAKTSDIGEFEVKRFLPSMEKRSVGPFIFFDQMGPAVLEDGRGMDVRPHPHIGLSTLTWLIEGEIEHRDSLGVVQTIRPGEVNWMTAGRGIVHSERTAADKRVGERPVFGLQIWMALPSDKQEIEPDFQHVKADQLPKISLDNADVTVIAGDAYGETSPVRVQSPTIYLDIKLNGQLNLPNEYEEQALFIVAGEGRVNGVSFTKGDFLILPSEGDIAVETDGDAHIVLLGGQALKNRRYLWWNFASTSKERIEQAKADWKEGRFDKVPGETEFIPLPD